MYVSLVQRNRDHAADVQEWSKFHAEEEILLSCCSKVKVLKKFRLSDILGGAQQ